MNLRNNKTKKGFGLIEILISMVIFVIGILAITSLNAKILRDVKDNEFTDFSDRVMVKSLEYFKSPTTSGLQTDILEQNFVDGIDVLSFSVSSDSLFDSIGSEMKFDKQDNVLPIDKCEDSSVYKVKMAVGSVYEGLLLCEQIIVDKGENGYKITSKIIYNVATETKLNQLVGYRPFTYSENAQ